MATQIEQMLDAENLNQCAKCRASRDGALFACPHCGHGEMRTRLSMTEQDHHAYEHSRAKFGSERRQGLLEAFINALFMFR